MKNQRVTPTSRRKVLKTSLMEWPWPGNIRELENFIERSVILTQGHTLNAPIEELRDSDSDFSGSSAMEDVEREHILRILRETGGVVSQTAKRLRVPRTTLNYMMKKHGISRTDVFRTGASASL